MNRNYPEQVELTVSDPFQGRSKKLIIQVCHSNFCFNLKDGTQEISIACQDIKPIFDLMNLYIEN